MSGKQGGPLMPVLFGLHIEGFKTGPVELGSVLATNIVVC